jgi:hypothetical protein
MLAEYVRARVRIVNACAVDTDRQVAGLPYGAGLSVRIIKPPLLYIEK